MSDAPQAEFQQEAADVLSGLESAVLALEQEQPETINAAFRALHTLKGSGAIAGYVEVERFAHVLENAFDDVRAGRRRISRALVDASLAALDHLATLVADTPEGTPELCRRSDEILALLERPTKAPQGPGIRFTFTPRPILRARV